MLNYLIPVLGTYAMLLALYIMVWMKRPRHAEAKTLAWWVKLPIAPFLSAWQWTRERRSRSG